MHADFTDVDVSVAKAERRIGVSCTLRNSGRELWQASAGFAVSYLIFDRASGTLVEEGKRTAFEHEVAPGQCVPVRLAASLPQQPGQYRIFVGPLQENVAWLYEKGSPFLLIDADVDSDGPRLRRQIVTTAARVQLERFFRSLGRAFWYPVRSIVWNRSLIRSLVRRDVAGRYRGSYGGLFWTVIHPLLMMVTYYFVFGVVLRARFADDDRPSSFVLYFLAGMLPWLAFSEAVGRSPAAIIEHSTFVKKLVFPIEIVPVKLAVAGLVSEAFGAVIFVAGMWYFGRTFAATVLYLPVLLIPQLLLTLGLCWFLAALGVFFRDIGQIIGFVLTLWFFITPICYPVGSLPANWLWLFQQNPLYILVGNYRRIFLEASAPDWRSLAKLAALSVMVFLAGHAWFYKLRRSFADLL